MSMPTYVTFSSDRLHDRESNRQDNSEQFRSSDKALNPLVLISVLEI